MTQQWFYYKVLLRIQGAKRGKVEQATTKSLRAMGERVSSKANSLRHGNKH